MRELLGVALVMVFGVALVYAETPENTPVSGSAVVGSAPESAPPEQSSGQSTGQADPVRRKSMTKTVLLWLVVPGGGNFYAGDKTKGFIELGGSVAGFALMASSVRDECASGSRFGFCDSEISTGRFFAGLGAAAGVRIWGLITAINRTQDINAGKITALERLRFSLPTKKEGFKVAYSFNF